MDVPDAGGRVRDPVQRAEVLRARDEVRVEVVVRDRVDALDVKRHLERHNVGGTVICRQ